jgi:Ca2+-binding RTX toxin-like protein
LALAGALGLPAAAPAAQVGVETISGARTQSQYLSYKAKRGERNRVTVTYSATSDTVRVRDTAGLTVLDGCARRSRTEAVCHAREREFGDQWELGDGNDTLRLNGAPRRAIEGSTVLDGSGNDVVLGSAIGDTFFDGPGRDKLSGRGGNDTLYAGPRPDVQSGVAGRDTVYYDAPLGSPRRTGVHADLDGRADDGSPREHDRIRTDVENLGGTPYADVLTGNGRANEIDGAGGADRIFGLGGRDTIDALGSAIVYPGSGADRVQGGRIVRARDGSRDTISACRLAVVDRRDAVRGCSRVERRG